jgi:hypothetical protein
MTTDTAIPKKLYQVEIIYSVMVAAIDADDAEFIAKYECLKEITSDESPYHVGAAEVTEARYMPPDWQHAIPYSADRNDERVCIEYFKDQPAAKESRERVRA